MFAHRRHVLDWRRSADAAGRVAARDPIQDIRDFERQLSGGPAGIDRLDRDGEEIATTRVALPRPALLRDVSRRRRQRGGASATK